MLANLAKSYGPQQNALDASHQHPGVGSRRRTLSTTMSLDAALASAHTKPATAEERAKPIAALSIGFHGLDLGLDLQCPNFPASTPDNDLQAIPRVPHSKGARPGARSWR